MPDRTDTAAADACTPLADVALSTFNPPTITTDDNVAELAGLEHMPFGLWLSDGVTDLTPLRHLVRIDGPLVISGAAGLERLDGLECLQHVEGLTLADLGALQSVEALARLEHVSLSVQLEALPRLAALDGLEHLGGEVSSLTLRLLPRVTSLRPVSGVDLSGGHLLVEGLSALVDLDLDGSWTSVASVHLSDNSDLRTLSGLRHLEAVTRSLTLTDNASVVSLDDLAALAFIDERLTVTRNAALDQVDGLSGVATPPVSVRISDNPNLCASDLSDLATRWGLPEIAERAACP